MSAADRARELVVPQARVLFALERRRRFAPHPEVGVAASFDSFTGYARQLGLVRAGRRPVPHDLGFAVLVGAGDNPADRCQRHVFLARFKIEMCQFTVSTPNAYSRLTTRKTEIPPPAKY